MDYFTKHLLPAHHRNARGEFLICIEELQKLRQEQALNKETSLATTDRRNHVSEVFCKGVLTHLLARSDTI